MPLQLYKLKLDLLHVPHFNVPLLYWKKTVITVHDLLWHEQRGVRVTTLHPIIYWLKYLVYRLVTWQAVTHAEHIFVPSAVVQKILLQFYPQIAVEKITVTHESIGNELARTAAALTPRTRKKNSILYVGSLYPHKNVSLIITALKQVPDWHLRIVASRSVFLAALKKEVIAQGVADRVHLLGKLSDSELAEEYATATCLVQPSFSEGFGLTGLEAMAFSTPVLASDIPIFHEVYQDAARYFDPHSVASFITALTTHSSEFKSDTYKKALHRVRSQYSWRSLARQTLAGYQSTLSV